MSSGVASILWPQLILSRRDQSEGMTDSSFIELRQYGSLRARNERESYYMLFPSTLSFGHRGPLSLSYRLARIPIQIETPRQSALSGTGHMIGEIPDKPFAIGQGHTGVSRVRAKGHGKT